MKSIVFAACAAAIAACASPASAARQSNTCVVDLSGTPYNQLSLRPTPCNNRAPIVNLANGAQLTNLHQIQSGCGFQYYRVGYRAPNGRYYKGWVGTDYVQCSSNPAPPTPPSPPQNIRCGSWSVQNGGPNNACGYGYTYTAGSYDTCSSSGYDCVSQCCSPQQGPVGQMSCGAWSVRHGGPNNACGSGYSYTAGDGDVCEASGDDCQSQCCSPLLY